METRLRPAPRLAPAEAAPAGGGPGKGLLPSGVLLGAGLGGFVDGIVFHMLLQWHHVLCVNCGSPSQTIDDLRLETFSDGVFHVFTLGLTLAGLLTLWASARRAPRLPPARWLVGALLLGWGIFNVVEGLLDHHLLGIHHVKPGPNRLAWDLGFLAVGALLALAGLRWTRSAKPAG